MSGLSAAAAGAVLCELDFDALAGAFDWRRFPALTVREENLKVASPFHTICQRPIIDLLKTHNFNKNVCNMTHLGFIFVQLYFSLVLFMFRLFALLFFPIHDFN